MPEAFLEATSLVGDVGFARERLAALREAGVTGFNLNPVGANPLNTIETIKDLAG